MTAKLLTANRLSDGEAVWWSDDLGWIERIEGATPVTSKDGEARLEAIGLDGVRRNVVVDVNIIDATLADGLPVPSRLRERIRAAGPTNRLDLGKQAGGRQDGSALPDTLPSGGDAHVSI